MEKLKHYLARLRESLWFLPTLIVAGMVALAVGLIELHRRDGAGIEHGFPLFFEVGAEGARGMLQVIATSLATVAGVAFSVVIVALSLAANQYSSRVLREFMRDRGNQLVLGVLVGVFLYCLVVASTIRGEDVESFVPAIAVAVGVVLAFVGIGFFIYFIHHIAQSMQATQILSGIGQATIALIERQYPDALADGEDDEAESGEADPPGTAWTAVPARRSGYIQRVDTNALLRMAKECVAIVRMERGVGDFVIRDLPIVSVAGHAPDEKLVSRLNAAFEIGRQRTLEQDVAFGVQQITDVALKSLSAGINDTTTALICVDWLTAILLRLVDRRVAQARCAENGALRLIPHGPTFGSLVDASFDPIRRNAEGNVAVLTRLLEALETLEPRTAVPRRRFDLLRKAKEIEDVVRRSVGTASDRVVAEAQAFRLARRLTADTAG